MKNPEELLKGIDPDTDTGAAVWAIRDALLIHFEEDSKNHEEIKTLLAPFVQNWEAASRLGRLIMYLLGILALVATIFSGLGIKIR